MTKLIASIITLFAVALPGVAHAQTDEADGQWYCPDGVYPLYMDQHPPDPACSPVEPTITLDDGTHVGTVTGQVRDHDSNVFDGYWYCPSGVYPRYDGFPDREWGCTPWEPVAETAPPTGQVTGVVRDPVPEPPAPIAGVPTHHRLVRHVVRPAGAPLPC